jgi:putative Holliday junction resolvase
MNGKRILGVDYGEVRIGLALSDTMGILATPLDTIANDAQTISKIVGLAKENEVEAIVIGYPLNLKGELGTSAQKVEAFISKLVGRGFEIIRWDESFSTSTAIDLLHQAGVKPHRDKKRIDCCAAAVILQDYLESRK